MSTPSSSREFHGSCCATAAHRSPVYSVRTELWLRRRGPSGDTERVAPARPARAARTRARPRIDCGPRIESDIFDRRCAAHRVGDYVMVLEESPLRAAAT